MERVLALDVGNKRIGVAVSDGLGWTAQGVMVIERRALADDLRQIGDLLRKYQTDKIVIGLPRNMNGTIGEQAELVQKFADALAAAHPVQIIWQDERLTTAAARRTLIMGDTSRERRKQVIDMLAAQMILETYLARKKRLDEFREPEPGQN